MDLLQEAKAGKKTFSIVFPSGERVIFRLLNWHDFKIYSELSLKQTIDSTVLETAIFKECVVNEDCISGMYDLRAGIIPTVVSVIMNMSGPSADSEVFNSTMDAYRAQVDTLESQIIMTICRAFPYTPEDLKTMNWPLLMARLAQAERILMHRQEMAEPIRMLNQEEAEKQAKKQSGQVDVQELVKQGDMLRNNPDFGAGQHDKEEQPELTRKQQQQLQLIQRMKQQRKG
jgi:hypothetical protein